MSIKKYALVSGDHVRYAELRETARFLLSDTHREYKFKKVDDDEKLASSRRHSDWSHVGYDVYEIDHPHVLSLIKKEKQKYFVFNVRQKLEKLYMERDMSFDKAKKINELLELGIEEK